MQTAKVGMKIVVPVGSVRNKCHATVVEIISGAEYTGDFAMSAMKEIDIVEVPQYFNGKVVCINAGNIPERLTVGKIYTFVDGLCNYDGHRMVNSPVKDCVELNRRFVSDVKFIEVVEDKNDPLTIEELKKMDGQKVYVIRLDNNCKETPEHHFCGWHKVDVKANKLIDKCDEFYSITSMNTSHGYHAYRQAPSK